MAAQLSLLTRRANLLPYYYSEARSLSGKPTSSMSFFQLRHEYERSSLLASLSPLLVRQQVLRFMHLFFSMGSPLSGFQVLFQDMERVSPGSVVLRSQDSSSHLCDFCLHSAFIFYTLAWRNVESSVAEHRSDGRLMPQFYVIECNSSVRSSFGLAD